MKINFDFSDPDKALAVAQRKIVMLSIGRLILFLSLLAVAVVGLAEYGRLLLLFIPLSFLFIYFILRFNEQKDREAFIFAVEKIKSDKKKRLKRELASLDPGLEFLKKSHPYANDLDLFGEHSLFQLINHTVSKGGKKKLADRMLILVDKQQATERNQAIRELSEKKHFLITYEAIGQAFLKEEKSKEKLYRWLQSPSAWKQIYWIPMLSGPILGFVLLTGILFGALPTYYLSVFIIMGLLLLGTVFKPLLEAVKAMPDDGDLKTYNYWAQLLENTSFSNDSLLFHQAPIKNDQFKSSHALKTLQQKSFIVQNRMNLMYLIFNILFWTDFMVLYRLEKWKEKYGHRVQKWKDAYEEWETLVSLASFTDEEQLSCEVEWVDRRFLSCKELKHPLIPPQKCIGNDFTLEEDKAVILLTGSNMSGKTTFMRTIGVNLVLIGMGLSPMATHFSTGEFLLYTSMRNIDSLGESVSSFYAELARIKGLLNLANQQKPVFFLLDEILKGTNTRDRIMGSEALIRQLIESPAKGIISTHDIELSELENTIPSLLNYSFHHKIEENEIHFDYKIKRGPCPDFNAQKLMELMGIRI